MSWKDELRPASFRGVPFHYEEAEGTGGRRLAEHVFPGRDEPFHEDMGRAARVFSLRAYVVGDDYMAKRRALETALDESGPGKLMHPYRGELLVACREYRVVETTSEGRMARFSITFVEGVENKFPGSAIDTRIATAQAADGANATVESVFNRVFNTSGKPDFVVSGASDLVRLASGDLRGLSGRLIGQPTVAPRFFGQLSSLESGASSLVRSPPTLSSFMTNAIRSLLGLQSPYGTTIQWSRGQRAPQTGVAQSLQSFGSTLSPVPQGTANRTTQALNQDAFLSLVRRTALVEEARLSADIAFDNRDDALAYRDDLADRLDGTMVSAAGDGADEIYASFSDLRTAVSRDLTTRSSDLQRLDSYAPSATQPSLAIAHRLYGDDPTLVLARADDIAARNRVRHPGFIGGGTQLEVLSDG